MITTATKTTVMQIVKVVGLLKVFRIKEPPVLGFRKISESNESSVVGFWKKFRIKQPLILCFLKNYNNLQFQVFETFQRTDRCYERTDVPG
jgi:hypothetical protein